VLQQRIDEAWHLRAACRGPFSDVFFPPPQFERKQDRREREGRAKAICRTCPVQHECLDYALAIREPHGIWGGLNEAERRAILAAEDAAGEEGLAAAGG
jgi:WhiB family redox-sensing transcriptional regulator